MASAEAVQGCDARGKTYRPSPTREEDAGRLNRPHLGEFRLIGSLLTRKADSVKESKGKTKKAQPPKQNASNPSVKNLIDRNAAAPKQSK
jgi:hypothetical protein